MRTLPKKFYPILDAQKRAILRSLQQPPILDDGEDANEANVVALRQLTDLMSGTTEKGEGNICLVIGPRGSGKTRFVDAALESLPERPVVVKLSGHAQLTDRSAVREMARQLTEQTGRAMELDDDMEDDNALDLDNNVSLLPPPSHILSLVSSLPSLPRPVVVVLDAFDLFAAHARQALLYCLFDTAQSCRVTDDHNGVAIIGVTSRVDSINLLEKRVKSRFSHRIIQISCPRSIQEFTAIAREILLSPPEERPSKEWETLWAKNVEVFMSDSVVQSAIAETFALSRSVNLLCRILIKPVLALGPDSPNLAPSNLVVGVRSQRAAPDFAFLPDLPYPAIGLLIAASHCRSAGHDAFTFEMLHERFELQVRTSSSAPVQLGGVSIGMLRCPRNVMMGAFEHLVQNRVFQPAGNQSSNVKEFVKYRCIPRRDEIKLVVEKMGQTNLKKWFARDQT